MKIKSSMIVGLVFFGCSSAEQNKDVPLDSKADSISYSIGADIGKGMRTQGLELQDHAFYTGWKDAYSNSELKIDDENCQKIINEFRKEFAETTRRRANEEGEKNLAAGQVFLAENAQKEGVVTLNSGLQYKILEKGIGEKPVENSKVRVHYRGTLLNGEEFDSSYKRGEPATFAVTGVIKGWTEALLLMPVGSKWELYVPSNLAYGNSPRGPGGPNNTLIFVVELLGIE